MKRRRRKKQCTICKKVFNPIHRLGFRQITCGDLACQMERKKRYDSSWHRKNRDLHNQEIADWFGQNRQHRKDYMQRYRSWRACNKSFDMAQVTESEKENPL